jgi:hypothetical protein
LKKKNSLEHLEMVSIFKISIWLFEKETCKLNLKNMQLIMKILRVYETH